MKELIERLIDDGLLREERIAVADALEAQAKQIEELSAALAAKDEALEQVRNKALAIIENSECRGARLAAEDINSYVVEAITLQPHASILNKIRADAVREVAQELLDCGFHQQVVEFVLRRAERIRKGEA